MPSVNEILDQVAGAEARLEGLLEAIRDGSPDGGVRLLTYNLRRRCSRLRLALEKLYPGEQEAAAGVPFRGRVLPLSGAVERLAAAAPEAATSALLLETALAHSKAMTAMYGELLQQELPCDLGAALQALRERELKDAGMLRKMIETNFPEAPAARP